MRSTLRAMTRTLVALVSAMQLQGCSRSMAAESTSGLTPSAVVRVENQTTRPLRIYVRAGGSELRLGVIQGLATQSFSVPSGFGAWAGEFALEARDRSATMYRSGWFTMPQGARASWILHATGVAEISVR
jgi:hypothetical protein